MTALQLTDTREQDRQVAIKYAGLIRTSISLAQSFVNDLLDLRLMRDGDFHLIKEAFKPAEIFELVLSVFKP